MQQRNVVSAHRHNRLLAAVGTAELDRLAPHLEVVDLAPRTVLVDVGERIKHVYFPHSAVICLMAVMQESGVAEAATIGSEGMAGTEALLGTATAANRMLVQVSGAASRIASRHLAGAIHDNAKLRTVLLRYTGAFIVQLTQSVACNSLHKLEERCCRWLLMAHDRAHRDHFEITQEFMAEMLGVHRPTVTIVARTLQKAGLIRYSRGVLTILDRKGLEASACECYGIVRRAHDEIFV